MHERTEPGGSPTSPIAYGYCAWHKGHCRGVRLILVLEAPAGPGTAGNLFACHDCQMKHGLIPLADRL
ncbi:hypothetical protein QFZ75_003703 [Streptomyces sp. V3I8]|uniref:hypothetical protein n=1 Tax=Streptomyces sp. V3I8 TaxID=3042279 RepID=UPI002783E726|nr:hypothetical protein [Streptomyces sp. V3I8]MDQ1037287.1 hypothetical protein [Streptomyces sp. V3I8]